FTKPFILEVDASHQGLGAALSQDSNSGQKVGAYANHSLRNHERYAEEPFILEVDASHQGLGAALSQDSNSGQKVGAYANHSLRNHERYAEEDLGSKILKPAIVPLTSS
ncbi:transposon Ty3-I Gag-Pol polyprotein, partial [Elysia marginata]